MINLQTVSDKTAISLSLLCSIHCLALPLLMVLLPSIAALPLADEAFHVWMVFAVVPISAYALFMGCKNHKNLHVLLLGGIGLFLLCVTAFLGHDLLGEVWEKALTVTGSAFIALGHLWNYHLCQQPDACDCQKTD